MRDRPWGDYLVWLKNWLLGENKEINQKFYSLVNSQFDSYFATRQLAEETLLRNRNFTYG